MDTGPDQDVPDFVPVRMLNEFVYCPRLAHIEWAGRQFADNEFTVEGRWQHRAVDREVGAAPSPEFAEQLREARSVELSSVRYGIVGRADIVRRAGGEVFPVEVKRGRPADTAGGVWPPELVQLRALGLLLEDNGYECSHGEVWFAETRQRVSVEFDGALTEQTLEAIRGVRRTVSDPRPPPPLRDSTKCNGCSVAGICLPDEIPILRRERSAPSRRLMPADGAARPVYVSEPGSYVGKSGGRLVVKRDRVTVAELRLIDVSELCVFGNVQVSTQVVRELMRREAAICWFSTGGWFSGITEGLPSKNVELRRRQVLMDDHARLLAASSMIEGKVRNCRTLLRRNTTDRDREALESLRRLARRAGAAASIAELLGVEGAAARLYFGQLPTMIRAPEGFAFDFGGRNRRPPKDRVNCLLSFTYSLLTKDCVGALRQVGFDPYIGVLHRPRFGRPALALDLAEELRPLLGDSVTLGVINNCEVTRSDFIVRAAGVALTHDGRRKLLRAYERRLDSEITHPVFGYRISWRRIIEVQARLLAAFVMGEVDSYTPMVTR